MYLNQYQCCGNLTRDPVLHQGQVPRAKFTIALNNPRKKDPIYIECIVWGDLALHFSDNCRKGTEVALTGELDTSTFKDERGSYHKVTTLVVKTFSIGRQPGQHRGPVDVPVPRPRLPE